MWAVAAVLRGRWPKKLALMILLWLALGATGFSQTNGEPSAPGAASATKDPAGQGDWHISWVPAYLWLSGANGNLGVAGKSIPVSASFSDVFDKLNIGYMTAFDVRKNRVGVLIDFQYIGGNAIHPPVRRSGSGCIFPAEWAQFWAQ